MSSECQHARVHVLNVLFNNGQGDSRFVYWRERCSHCARLILSRALRSELPDRVIHHLRNQPASNG